MPWPRGASLPPPRCLLRRRPSSAADDLGRGLDADGAMAVRRPPGAGYVSGPGRSSRADVEFRLLGPLEVVRGGEPVPLAGVRQRAVLAVLVLHANEVVGTERLVDAVWGDDAPLTAAKIVHNSVSQLRKLLEPNASRDGRHAYELLMRHRSGYELRVELDQL